jgi:hypothetical protein
VNQKQMLGCPSGLGNKHKFSLQGGDDFHLEAHQVLRLVDILTFTALVNVRQMPHQRVLHENGGVVLSAEGQWNVLECSRIFHQIGSTGRWCTRVLAE